MITSLSTGIATISGLPHVGNEELVSFAGGRLGMAFNVDEAEVGLILLCDYQELHVGDEVRRTGRVMDVGVGDALLGRVINPLGRPLDGQPPAISQRRLPVERPAPAIMDRAPVSIPLQTGLKVIDAILNQRGKNVICVYCAIAQRASSVAKVIANLREKGAMEYTVVVVAEGNDAPGLVYITPYAATSIAEHFMEQGRDVLIVYDDLTQHAQAYRELSLLLRRPPGREAYPGDIFYIHSRMLERSTHLIKELGGGSLTALPIIETDAQDISAYIPTNLISITDGQVYLSPTLFELGVLPAVDVAQSVSRVGSQAQKPAYRAVAGDLKLAYSQFEELESFAKFGTHLDEATRKTINHGQRIRACLKQPQSQPVPVAEQIVVLIALQAGLFDPLPLDKIPDGELALQKALLTLPKEVAGRLVSDGKLSDADHKTVIEVATAALASLQPKPGPGASEKAGA